MPILIIFYNIKLGKPLTYINLINKQRSTSKSYWNIKTVFQSISGTSLIIKTYKSDPEKCGSGSDLWEKKKNPALSSITLHLYCKVEILIWFETNIRESKRLGLD